MTLHTLPQPRNGAYRVVIVGNGIGGVSTARALEKLLKRHRDLAEVTIIGRDDRFVYKPMLPDALNSDNAGMPMSDVFSPSSPVTFHQATVTGFSVEPGESGDKFVHTSTGSLPFDYLVYSPGGQTNYFNISGANTHALPLEEEQNLETIRKVATDKLEAAVKADPNSTEQGKNLSFVIVGAGATGVELAFELKYFMERLIDERFPRLRNRFPRITLVEATGDILPGFTDTEKRYARRRMDEEGIELLLNSMVLGVTEDGILQVKDMSSNPGREYRIHTIAPMWVTGIQSTPLNDALPFEKTSGKNQLIVNEFLEIPGRPDIYAIGDASIEPDVRHQGKMLPDTGQVAEQSGVYAAYDLYRKMADGKIRPGRRPFVFHSKGVMLSTGPVDGLLRTFDRFILTGWIASRIRQAVYRYKLHG